MQVQAVWEQMAAEQIPAGIKDNGGQYFVINGNGCTRAVNTLKRRGLIEWTVTGSFFEVTLTDAGRVEMKRFKAMRDFAKKQRADHEKAMRR